MRLKVSPSPLHGLGCFAVRSLAAGEVVAQTKLLVFPPEETENLMKTHAKNYLFFLRDGPTEDGPYFAGLAMGPMSFCNHSPQANCSFAVDEGTAEVVLTARQDIAPGEEITIDYGDYAEKII